jgi:hypothetical protein
MKSCPEYEEFLLLDAYGELDPRSKSLWGAHLASCRACKEESRRMLQMVATVKETLTPPPLTAHAGERLVKAVRESANEAGDSAWPLWGSVWQWFCRPWRFSTALATACVFAVLVSLLSLGPFQGLFHRNGTPGQEAVQTLGSEDVEIINHLDFLRQLDSLQRLVQTLDEPDGDPVPEPTSNSRGMESS